MLPWDQNLSMHFGVPMVREAPSFPCHNGGSIDRVWKQLCVFLPRYILASSHTATASFSVTRRHRFSTRDGPLHALALLQDANGVAQAEIFFVLLPDLVDPLQDHANVTRQTHEDLNVFVREAAERVGVLVAGLAVVVVVPLSRSLLVERLQNGNHPTPAVQDRDDRAIPVALAVDLLLVVAPRGFEAQRVEIVLVHQVAGNVPGRSRQHNAGDDPPTERDDPRALVRRRERQTVVMGDSAIGFAPDGGRRRTVVETPVAPLGSASAAAADHPHERVRRDRNLAAVAGFVVVHGVQKIAIHTRMIVRKHPNAPPRRLRWVVPVDAQPQEGRFGFDEGLGFRQDVLVEAFQAGLFPQLVRAVGIDEQKGDHPQHATDDHPNGHASLGGHPDGTELSLGAGELRDGELQRSGAEFLDVRRAPDPGHVGDDVSDRGGAHGADPEGDTQAGIDCIPGDDEDGVVHEPESDEGQCRCEGHPP
mmetsp:Transcript_5213/g.13221  ORF Transcript_5213/g.13221 Transcript_5213/m.13221 type:complete len:477 (-) Transcript_5213:170-1600(-)